MASRPTSTLTWQVSRTRMRVVHAGAQYALYFGLGLAVVSMLIGLNVFLASQTTAMRADIRKLTEAADQVLWENADISAYIAEQTSIHQIDLYAIDHGYAEADRFLYVQPISTGQPWTAIIQPERQEPVDQEMPPSQLTVSPAINAVLNGLVDWVESPPQSADVAWIR